MLSRFLFAIIVIAMPQMVFGQSESADENPLKVLEPFVGMTWKGEVTPPGSEEALYDVSRWEWALGGHAIRIVHSVADGQYAGESLLTWDSRSGTIVYFYATTGGFYTRGTMYVDNNQFEVTEVVTGNSDGILGVKATGALLDDGSLEMITSMRSRSGWSDPDTTLYVPAPDATVVLPKMD